MNKLTPKQKEIYDKVRDQFAFLSREYMHLIFNKEVNKVTLIRLIIETRDLLNKLRKEIEGKN